MCHKVILNPNVYNIGDNSVVEDVKVQLVCSHQAFLSKHLYCGVGSSVKLNAVLHTLGERVFYI